MLPESVQYYLGLWSCWCDRASFADRRDINQNQLATIYSHQPLKHHTSSLAIN